MTREEAAIELRSLVDTWCDDEHQKKAQIESAHAAIAGFVEGDESLSNRDARDMARDLEKASASFLKELRRSEAFWPYLSTFGPSGHFDAGTGINKTKYFAKDTWIPKISDILMQVETIERAASSLIRDMPKDIFVQNAKNVLGTRLAFSYFVLSGKNPSAAHESDFENPRGHFSRFVMLAIASSPHEASEQLSGIKASFVSFINAAVQYHRRVSELDIGEE